MPHPKTEIGIFCMAGIKKGVEKSNLQSFFFGKKNNGWGHQKGGIRKVSGVILHDRGHKKFDAWG